MIDRRCAVPKITKVPNGWVPILYSPQGDAQAWIVEINKNLSILIQWSSIGHVEGMLRIVQRIRGEGETP